MYDVLPEIQPLLADDRLNELGPGSPNLAVKPLLQELERELPKKAKDRDFALACLAGLWLRHDFLDESHAISQDLDTVEGSYWHALMHRRKLDYSNAKYWFRSVGTHDIFDDLHHQAAAITFDKAPEPSWKTRLFNRLPKGCEFLVTQEAWGPLAFVDFCKSAANGEPWMGMLCRRIQRCEWELLFHYCHERAFAIRA